MHLRNSWTRSASAWSYRHSTPGRGEKGGILFAASKFQETSVTRSLITGKVFIGRTTTGRSSGRESSRLLHINRGFPFTSAEQEPHFAALQFHRTARSGAPCAWIQWTASRATIPGETGTRDSGISPPLRPP